MKGDQVAMASVRVMFTAVGADGDEGDFVLNADASTPVSAVAGLLGAERLYVGRTPLDLESDLSDGAILDGSVVRLDRPEGAMDREPASAAEIRVAGGPVAGAVHRLDFGETTIGSGQAATIRLPDPQVPELALHVTVDPDGSSRVAPHPGVQATLDGEPLGGTAAWQPGRQVAVGGSLLCLAPYARPDAVLLPSEDGAGLDFNRPPRPLPPPKRITRFQLPVPPPPFAVERRPMPILMAVVPVVLGVAMAYFTHEIYLLAMSALSPVMLIGNHFSERKQGRKSYTQQMANYCAHKARIERAALAALDAERAARHAECPDPGTALSIVSGPRYRLWERRRTDPDYLLLRVGTADLPSSVELTGPEQDEHRRQAFRQIPDAPVAVGLKQHGVLGIAGPDDAPGAIARWLLAQAASLHSPNDLQIYVLTDAAGKSGWDWVRWLPHCRPTVAREDNSQNCIALIGNDAKSVAARTAELLSLISRRRILAESGEPQGKNVAFENDVLVVFDGSRKLRSLPGVIQILREGPRVGIYAICLDTDERVLPAECQAIAVIQQDSQPDGVRDGLRVQQTRAATVYAARPDYVSAGWCTLLARAMAPIRDVSDAAAGLPESSRLLDVLRLAPPSAEAVAARWNAGGRSTLAMIGQSYDGPFGIDLRRDGPHGLIAGTTGSGKSELLQSIVASLAVANRPDEMTFLLVDYKGGSAFKECAELPHTVGMVTDLDTHLVERALVSLSGELGWREQLLAAAGVKSVEDYQLLRDRERSTGQHSTDQDNASQDSAGQYGRARGRLDAMPRLLIVVDEFASLVRDLPDFVAGLVNIAQRGRSLGIHLILATQRPSGVVSADIRANTNLRIALRVTDPAESADVIDASDAAYISRSTPGRAYIRLHDADPVPVQTCRVSHFGRTVPLTSITPIAWEHLGEPMPRGEVTAPRGEADLTALVGAIEQASAQLGLPAPHQPWLPVMPAAVLLSELSRPAWEGDRKLPAVPFGLLDLPGLQAQRPALISLADFSHLMAAGAPRSGLSQLLRTIAGTLAQSHSCADVHMYGIDCGNGALLPLTDLPHCGAVVTRTQARRAIWLIDRLDRELDRRQELLAETRFRTIGDQRKSVSQPQRLPHIVVFLDRWTGFTSTLGEIDSGRLTLAVMRLLREGQPAGMHLIVTGGRPLLASKISRLFEFGERLVFKLADKGDYALAGLRPAAMPDDMPPGRAFRTDTSSGLEVQVALLAADASGQGQAAALRALAEAAAVRDAHVALAQRPFRVEAASLVSDMFHVGDAQGRPVGREDVLAWLRARHSAGGSVALLGPRRAGKTWVLRELERRLTGDGRRQVHSVDIQLPSTRIDTPNQLARVLDPKLPGRSPAQRMLEAARRNAGTPDRLAYLLDEVGRLSEYGPAAVSWLRDLGQAGAWLVYTGTERDWQDAVRQALKAPGSSFGNDVDARTLGPLDERDAVVFLTGTAANLRVSVSNETAAGIVSMVGAWPFYLQVVGDAVVRAVQADNARPLQDAGALRKLIDASLLDGWVTHFRGRWTEIGPGGRSALLEHPGRLPDNLTPAQREDLRYVGLLLPGDRWLADPPFFGWIARNATALGDGERLS